MKILVAVKRVVDYNVQIRVKSDGTDVDTDGVKMSMNPFDEIAVEQAVQLKESGLAKDVVAVTIGPAKCHETLRTALAIGVDRAIHIETTASTPPLEPLSVAKILREVADREAPDLFLLGKQAIDDDAAQVPQMLAARLGWGQGTFVSQCEFDRGVALVTREIDGGKQTLRLSLPCVISVDLALNKPRFVTLPNIMKAKKKPVETVPIHSYNIDFTPHLEILNVAAAKPRSPGQMVTSVAQLVEKLKIEAKVL